MFFLCYCVQVPYNWIVWLIRLNINGIIILGNAIAMLALFFTSLEKWGSDISTQVRCVIAR